MPVWVSISVRLADWRSLKDEAIWTLSPVEYAGISKDLDIGTTSKQVLFNGQRCPLTPSKRKGDHERRVIQTHGFFIIFPLTRFLLLCCLTNDCDITIISRHELQRENFHLWTVVS